ncbi:ATP-dependent DNA ligase [Actinomadura pelletieri DSM 43383]|uniref:ATP-dependent DNA ligase n=1 Tax=Actinomadura pelletieri DSM 43383 TaxID=1120940 RepID=A0A495QAW7_9ACTN|nr:ATP-dependent DNA ligase [Actinomadura pelletieri]RKS68654.1 ATP-dependent DNA ligase [Actinomadura pelletieri DSM 43383]
MHIRSPVRPMLATAIDRIPPPRSCPGGCRYEPKFDGFRAIAIVDDGGAVRLSSRRRTRLDDAFPEIVAAVRERLAPGTVVDGEIVRWGRDGRLDFGALQRRHAAGRRRAELARTEPCHYVVFDVLESGGEDLRPRPLRDRRAVLEALLGDAGPSARVVITPQTSEVEEATVWFDALAVQGVEGLVVKDADGPYLEGRRRWRKVKRRVTTEAIVGGVTGTRQAPESLILGRYDEDGRLRVVARTTPLPPDARAALGDLLQHAGPDHPWPAELPAGLAGGVYGSHPPIRYVRTEPETVVEISADAAIERGRWRHAVRFVRVRPDLEPWQVPPFGA